MGGEGLAELGGSPSCPFCDGSRTKVVSPFGSHASLAACWCDDCRSPFEVLRWRDAGDASDAASRQRPPEGQSSTKVTAA